MGYEACRNGITILAIVISTVVQNYKEAKRNFNELKKKTNALFDRIRKKIQSDNI